MLLNSLFFNLLTLNYIDHKKLYFNNIKISGSDKTQHIVLMGEDNKRSIYNLSSYKIEFNDGERSINNVNGDFSVKGILLEYNVNDNINLKNILDSIVTGILFVHISINLSNGKEEKNIIKGDLNSDRYTIENILSREIRISNFYLKYDEDMCERNCNCSNDHKGYSMMAKSHEKFIAWKPIVISVYSFIKTGETVYKDFQQLRIYNLKFQNEIKCYRISHFGVFQGCKIDGNIFNMELITACIKSKENEPKKIVEINQHKDQDNQLIGNIATPSYPIKTKNIFRFPKLSILRKKKDPTDNG
ncbi:hypothetical protein SLOPH_731 [Spraguea lophii 42_110]|uniref:Uncharacterized protein n=1 Tax=Spraguea lophii (strain 42_110) TaxID=1358809 RepID=S7W4Q9_SPRLO|nr:hypothetical protein SLOPH_731 [Spraguea lophii 42_110]